MVKINTDASFTSIGAGYGYVLRDASGKVLLSGVRAIKGLCITFCDEEGSNTD